MATATLESGLYRNRQRRGKRDSATRRIQVERRSDVRYGIARDYQDVVSALGIVYDSYLREGLIGRAAHGLRVTRYHLLPTTEILLAKVDGAVTCTATLVQDNTEYGLPMQSIYEEELVARRGEQAKLAEVSCLASQGQGASSLAGLVGLMALTVQCAHVRGADEVVIAVHPHHVEFYTRFLGFRPFGPLKSYPAVCHHPAEALTLDLHHLREHHPRGYERLFGKRFPCEFFEFRPLPKSLLHLLRSLLTASEHQRSIASRS